MTTREAYKSLSDKELADLYREDAARTLAQAPRALLQRVFAKGRAAE